MLKKLHDNPKFTQIEVFVMFIWHRTTGEATAATDSPSFRKRFRLLLSKHAVLGLCQLSLVNIDLAQPTGAFQSLRMFAVCFAHPEPAKLKSRLRHELNSAINQTASGESRDLVIMQLCASRMALQCIRVLAYRRNAKGIY